MLFRNLLILCATVLFISAGDKPDLLKVDGLVTVDGVPCAADIEINSALKAGRYYSHLITTKTGGNFTTQLPLKDDYEIVVKVPNFPQQVLMVSAVSLTAAGVLNVFADFTSPEYDQKLEALKASVEEKLKLQRRYFDTGNFEKTFGNAKAELLQYQVQVAAYRFFENFNYNNVLGFPKIIRHTDPDQITRFTMGSFATYNEAKDLLSKLQKDSLKDSFIIAIYKGEKKLLSQLVNEGVFD